MQAAVEQAPLGIADLMRVGIVLVGFYPFLQGGDFSSQPTALIALDSEPFAGAIGIALHSANARRLSVGQPFEDANLQ